jgi:hypothetical protein
MTPTAGTPRDPSSDAKETRLQGLQRQVLRVERRIIRLEGTSYRYSWFRIAAFLLTLVATAVVLYLAGWQLAVICLVAGFVPFGLAVYAHRQVETSIERHRTWIQIKTSHLARARLDWDEIPAGFRQRPRPDHPFEADLDIVGGRSVLRLLDTAVSFEGNGRLRSWLTAPVPDASEVARRQGLVEELAPRSLFRDKLSLEAMVAASGSKTWEANSLRRWLERPAGAPQVGRWLLLLVAMAALNALLFAASRAGLLPAWWQITLVIYLGLTLMRSRAVAQVWDEALALGDALLQLRAVFAHLEGFHYHRTAKMRALCDPFLDAVHRPSRYLVRITRVVAAMGVRGNPLLWFALNVVVPWDAFFAYQLERTKAGLAKYAPAWMDVWFELEALSSLANLSYLNPDYALPEIQPGQQPETETVFRAQGLGHPLLPDSDRVYNDFSVPELGQVAVITGSNMAGKSVFLKTVGLNLALAYAGGPVCADRLETRLFRLFTCLEVADSVVDGISYFYAEVQRLKALLAALEVDHPLPLLFCIDEIFRGTNNRERLAGSRAYIRALAGQQGTGLIATHDLALTELAGEVPQVVNYHFRDHVADGRMAFDYALRPGPCPTTNALTIMHLEGLPVPGSSSELRPVAQRED